MDDTPDMLTAIETDLGVTAAKKLVSVYGGQEITIPRTVDSVKIKADLGSVLTDWLVEEYGGMQVHIPIGHKYRKNRVRNTVIANPDKSANELARMCRVTSVRIRQIRREERQKADAALSPT